MPDGRIGFAGSTDNSEEIFAASRDGGPLFQITHTPDLAGTTIPTWPSNGGPLAFTAKQAGSDVIFIADADGAARPISPAGTPSYAPAWAPNGMRIAFQTNTPGRAGIITVAPDGTDLQQVVLPESDAWARSPAWSPDSQWIAYVSNRKEGLKPACSDDCGDVYVVSAAGGESVRVTSDGKAYDWRPAWLPD